jgi:ethanolamine ammonia-lyase small subunit
MKKDKTTKHKGIANPRYAREMHELRRSGAAGLHLDKRTKRVRTRQSSEFKAIQDYTE